MRRILITGGAGFIGSHCVEWFLKRYPHYYIVNLDKLSYAARPGFARRQRPHYHFVKGDVGNFPLVLSLFEAFKFDSVMHLAAESHVDRSIIDPLLFLKSNVEGTAILLHAAYTHWFSAPQEPHYMNHRFIYVSTDEVYGALQEDGRPFRESDIIRPTNPYSASKAAAECLVKGYMHTYGLDAIITRSTNNYGSYQCAEKLIPMVLEKALQEEPIALHGDGKSIRDWLHVEDHCSALDAIFHEGEGGEIYNIGANQPFTNLDITLRICRILDRLKPLKNKSYTSLIRFITERIGQDRRYELDATKIRERLQWEPSIALKEGIERLIYRQINEV